MTSLTKKTLHPSSGGGRINRIRNVLSNWGRYVITAGINFMLAPFIVHSLGDVSYGIWVLLGSVVGYLGLLDLGVRGAVTRFIAKYHTQSDHIEATRVASSALVIFALMGLVAIILSAFLAIFIGHFFQIPADLIDVAQVVLILAGVNMAVSMVSGVYGGVIVGLQRFDYANTVEVVMAVLRGLAIVWALSNGLGLLVLASIQLGMSGLRGIANFWLCRHLYPQMRTTLADCRRSHISLIISFSISVLLLQASGMLILFSDSIVIGAFLPLGMVTFFAIAANLTEYARAPISGITHTVTPWVSTLEAKDDLNEVQNVLLATARIATLIVLPIVLTFMLRGETFIGLWMGAKYATPSGDVLWILSLALLFAVGYQVVVSTMMGISRHSGLVPAFVVEAIFNVGLSVAWIGPYGIVGVAWGTLLPRLVASCLFAPWYARRVLGTSVIKFWMTTWVKPFVAMVPFGLGSIVVERWWQAENLFVFFAQVIIVLPLSLLGAWVICLTPAEKERVLPGGLLKRRTSQT